LADIFIASGELADHEAELSSKLTELEKHFAKMEFRVLFAGEYNRGNAIVSIHAGTGGVDAMDWAQMLLRLYLRFCERHGFTAKIVDESPGSEAGIKSVTLEVTGDLAYGWLKSENGVHRLVRISPYDAEKMRHTSFALVEVLPETEDIQAIELKDEDLKIDVFRAGGHGGQSVNTTDSAVRITHLPTGIQVKCQNERSQLQNKNLALKILRAKLLKYYQESAQAGREKMKGEHRQAEWGNQARSYVLQPYRLVKDHRTDFETADTEKVLDGEIDDFVEAFLKWKAQK
jgi:peptide chain release factor 2